MIAVACWAASRPAEAASRSNAALIRLDIKRRDALTGTITSPLLGLIKPGTPATAAGHHASPDRAGPARGRRQPTWHPARPIPLQRPDAPRPPAPAIKPAPAAGPGTTSSDWI